MVAPISRPRIDLIPLAICLFKRRPKLFGSVFLPVWLQGQASALSAEKAVMGAIGENP